MDALTLYRLAVEAGMEMPELRFNGVSVETAGPIGVLRPASIADVEAAVIGALHAHCAKNHGGLMIEFCEPPLVIVHTSNIVSGRASREQFPPNGAAPLADALAGALRALKGN